ncbi:MAG: hypothetical protein A2V66_04545 [Ignavibacteria bacterium RBG_13_36_8]|nr:MAG: hypothetical protein A2V66_04545 [Ignavibacteria bacterium RBG_13_36_8]
MKALILAAGLGTRLKPLTNNIPKALVELNNKTLLQITIDRLISFEITDIIINVHHFADQIIDYLKISNSLGVNISVSDERELLLDTGGGIKKAAWFFDDGNPFVVHNVDVISDLDLRNLYDFHVNSNSLATLSVKKRHSDRYLLCNAKDELCGWKNVKTGEVIISKQDEKELTEYAYSGIQVVDPKIFNYFPKENVFSVIGWYLELAKRHKIKICEDTNSFWLDIGKKENLAEAGKYFKYKNMGE